MIHIKRRGSGIGLFVLVSMGVTALTTSAFGIQAPSKVPAMHER